MAGIGGFTGQDPGTLPAFAIPLSSPAEEPLGGGPCIEAERTVPLRKTTLPLLIKLVPDPLSESQAVQEGKGEIENVLRRIQLFFIYYNRRKAN